MNQFVRSAQVVASDLRHFSPYLWFALAFLAAFLFGALVFYLVGRYKGQLESPRLHEREWNALVLRARTAEAGQAAAERVVRGLELANAQLVAAKRPELNEPRLEVEAGTRKNGAVMKFKLPGKDT